LRTVFIADPNIPADFFFRLLVAVFFTPFFALRAILNLPLFRKFRLARFAREWRVEAIGFPQQSRRASPGAILMGYRFPSAYPAERSLQF
jgi:hypothetical protein